MVLYAVIIIFLLLKIKFLVFNFLYCRYTGILRQYIWPSIMNGSPNMKKIYYI
jgi:hypothetical protein